METTTKKPEFVYKVVRKCGPTVTNRPNNYMSSSGVGGTNYFLTYTIGEETVADKHTPGIFIFTDPDHARQFMYTFIFSWTDLRILKCTYRGRLKRRKLLLLDEAEVLTKETMQQFTDSYKELITFYNKHKLESSMLTLPAEFKRYGDEFLRKRIRRAPEGTFTVPCLTPISIERGKYGEYDYYGQ